MVIKTGQFTWYPPVNADGEKEIKVCTTQELGEEEVRCCNSSNSSGTHLYLRRHRVPRFNLRLSVTAI